MTESDRADLPHGIKLVHNLESGGDRVSQVVWSPSGQALASAADGVTTAWTMSSDEPEIVFSRYKKGIWRVAWTPDERLLITSDWLGSDLWELATGHRAGALNLQNVVAFSWSPDGLVLASATDDHTIRFLDRKFADLGVRPFIADSLKLSLGRLCSIAWSPDGLTLASGISPTMGPSLPTLALWASVDGELIGESNAHEGRVNSVAWSPDGEVLVSGSDDRTIRVWNTAERLTTPSAILEGHTSAVVAVAFSPCGRLIASRGHDDGIRLWRRDTWASVGNVLTDRAMFDGLLDFHPTEPLLATGSGDRVHVWKLDPDRILDVATPSTPVTYTTAKVVLVGNSGVGKTGLGWRLAHGEFKEHASTHGQQFWMLDNFESTRADGAQLEVTLWDFAGQPDYRLLHALFLGDAELALVLLDPTDRIEPFRGTDYWLRGLTMRSTGPCPVILVGA